MAQFARPNSDISNTGWSPSTGTTLWGCVDEVTASDTDFITGTSTSAVCTIGLSSVEDPLTDSGFTFRIRAKANGSGAGERWTVELRQGATLIRTVASNATLARTWTDISVGLLTIQSELITDFSALSVYITPTSAGASESVDVSWIEFEIPDVPTAPTNVVLNIITNM